MYFREGGAVHPWKPLLYHSRTYARRRHLQLVPMICLPQAFISASALHSSSASYANVLVDNCKFCRYLNPTLTKVRLLAISAILRSAS
jgi:hypothetical protein